MSWISDTLANLKSGLAFKIMVMNFKANPWQCFKNELSPSSWTNPDRQLHWANLYPEMIGWGKHIVIGAVGAAILRFFGVSDPKILMVAAISSFVVEIIQFLVARASFVNPINSLLDIGFYVLGAYLLMAVL